jgi:hypothetical protein
MNNQDETERTAARLRDALGAAADVMVGYRAPARQRDPREHPRAQRAGGWLIPLAAAAGVVVIALGAVLVAHLGGSSPHGTSTAGGHGGPATAAAAPRPEYYLTATYPSAGPNVLVFQVRRVDDGAVTGSKTISGANLGWGGDLSAAASGRAFYFGSYPCKQGAGIPTTTFYRITITSAGQISSFAPTGRRITGMVVRLAASPDGTQMAYSAIDKACASGGIATPGAASVNVENLTTGAVRTWQDKDATARTLVNRLSWAPDARSIVVEETAALRAMTVYRLDATSSGGSLQAHSTTVLKQGAGCSSTCVLTELAGPGDSLIALELKGKAEPGQPTVVLIVRIPATGHPVDLYGENVLPYEDIYTDPSARWILLWPSSSIEPLGHPVAGWISGGRLHPLPGVGEVSPQGITW